MKKLTILLAALALLFGTVADSLATPMYYTFEGSVTSIGTMISGSTTFEFPTETREVTYTFLIDTELSGYQIVNSNTQVLIDRWGREHFYAEYIAGTAIERPETGFDSMASYYGYTDYGRFTFIGSLSDYYYNGIVISGNSLTVGSVASGTDYYMDSSYGSSTYYSGLFVHSNLTLMSISTTDPTLAAVPEPSTMLLHGSGLLGLVGLNRRRKA